MKHRLNVRIPGGIAAVAILISSGCQAPDYFEDEPRLSGVSAPAAFPADRQPHQLPIFRGRDGVPLSWGDVMRAIDWADVVVMGERHDDPVGHRLQQTIYAETLTREPNTALALEMLERDEQAVVNAYLQDLISRDQFLEAVRAEGWQKHVEAFLAGDLERDEFEEKISGYGWFDWMNFYQPSIDIAKEAGAPVIAANAPRTYVRLARSDGYARLRALSDEERRLFCIPHKLDTGRYRDRFWQVMGKRDYDDPEPEPQVDAEGDEVAAHAAMSNEDIKRMFRSQSVWDATMGQSVARGLQRGADKVLLLIGGFHADFEGGTVQQIRYFYTRARIVTISVVPRSATSLQPDDVNRADIVIYSGDMPEDEEAEEVDDEEAEPETDPDAEGGESAEDQPTSQPETTSEDESTTPPTSQPDTPPDDGAPPMQ